MKLCIILWLLLLTVLVMGQTSQSGAVLIRNVRVSDGQAGALVNTTILVVDGLARRMESGDSVPSGVLVIDGGGSMMTMGADGAIRLTPISLAFVADQLSDRRAMIRTGSLTKADWSPPTRYELPRVTGDDVQAQQPQKAAPQDASQKGGGGDLAQQAADPTAPLMAFNFKYEYVSSFYGIPGDAHAFTFQPVVPFRAWKQSHLLRTTVGYDISGPGGSGLANVSIFDLIVFNKEWGRWGVGPLVQFTPNRGPGRDTISAGPAIGFVAKKGKWNLGMFNQNLFGHDTRFSSVQPVIAYILPKGWSLSSGDAQWSIDWTEPQFVNIPIGVQVAKVTKLAGQPVRLFFNPEYNARNVTGAPHWSFRFGLTILAPAK